jgi:hypothetical protein
MKIPGKAADRYVEHYTKSGFRLELNFIPITEQF